MKKIVFLVAALPLFSFGQTEKDACETLSKINTIIQQQHYRPKPVDDSLSVYVFEDFMKKLDDDNRLFTEIEVNNLKKHKLKIDDYLKESNCDFLNDFYKAYNSAVERYRTTIEAIKKEPFVFKSTETIQFFQKSLSLCKG